MCLYGVLFDWVQHVVDRRLADRQGLAGIIQQGFVGRKVADGRLVESFSPRAGIEDLPYP